MSPPQRCKAKKIKPIHIRAEISQAPNRNILHRHTHQQVERSDASSPPFQHVSTRQHETDVNLPITHHTCSATISPNFRLKYVTSHPNLIRGKRTAGAKFCSPQRLHPWSNFLRPSYGGHRVARWWNLVRAVLGLGAGGALATEQEAIRISEITQEVADADAAPH
jgi:hypothetical protein